MLTADMDGRWVSDTKGRSVHTFTLRVRGQDEADDPQKSGAFIAHSLVLL